MIIDYVLVIMMHASTLRLAEFTGPNALADCLSNGQRITEAERDGARVFPHFRRAHCQSIERSSPQ